MRRYIYSERTGKPQDIARPITEDLDLLEKSARETGMTGPLRAIQLHAYTDDDGPTFQLCGIFEEPSWEDSRYATEMIASYDESFSWSPEIREVGQMLATRLDVPFHYVFEDGPRWARTQGAPPRRDFPMQWRARWWKNDGIAHSIAGEDVAQTKNLEEAHQAMHSLVVSRIGPEAVRIECEVRDPIRGEWRWPQVLRSRSNLTTALVEALRQAYRQSNSAASMIREVRARHGNVQMLELLENIACAFDLEMAQLDAVSGWIQGTLGDQELDDDLNPRILAREVKWNAVFTLRRRLEAGEALSVILHEHCAARGSFGFMEVYNVVAEALDCRFGRRERQKQWALCQEAVSEWLMRRYPANDDTLDQALGELIAEQFPQRKPFARAARRT